MKRKNKLSKNKLQTIIARLLEIRFKIEDYIYSNKPINKTEAMKYLEEITAFTLKSKNMIKKDSVRTLQVSNTIISQLKVIIEEEDTIIDKNIELGTTFVEDEEREKLNYQPDKSTNEKWGANVVNNTQSNNNEQKHVKVMNTLDVSDTKLKNIPYSNILTPSEDVNKDLVTLTQSMTIDKENTDIIEISSDNTSDCGSQSILLGYDPNDVCYNNILQYANSCTKNPNETATNVFCNDADSLTDSGNTEKYYLDKNNVQHPESDSTTKGNKNTATEKEEANDNDVLLQTAANVEIEYSQSLVTNNKKSSKSYNNNNASRCCDLEEKSYNGIKLHAVNNLKPATITKKVTHTKIPVINKPHTYIIKSIPKIKNYKAMQIHNNNTGFYNNTNNVYEVDKNNIKTGQINKISECRKDSINRDQITKIMDAQKTINKEAIATSNFKVIKSINNNTGNSYNYKNKIDLDTAKTNTANQICSISKESFDGQDTQTVINYKINDTQNSNKRQKPRRKRNNNSTNNKERKSRKLDIGKDNSNYKRGEKNKESSIGECNDLKETNDLVWLSEIKYVRVVGVGELCEVHNLSEGFWTDFSLLPDLSESDFIIS